MNILCKIVKEFMDNDISMNEISRLSDSIYEKYHSIGKNLFVAFKETNLNKKLFNIQKYDLLKILLSFNSTFKILKNLKF